MNIGIDARSLMDEYYSGVSEHTYQLVREILEHDPKNSYFLFYNSFNKRKLHNFDNHNIQAIKFSYPNKILNYFFFSLLNSPKIDEKIGSDIFFMPHLNFIALKRWDRSLITIHDLSFLRFPEYFSLKKKVWHASLRVKQNLKKYRKIIAVSRHTKRDIVELCGVSEDKIEIIHPGISSEFTPVSDDVRQTEYIRKKYDLPDKFILYLGNIEPRKNIIGVIRAYEALRKKLPRSSEYKLIIAGKKGWKSAPIYRAVKASTYRRDIRFLGYVPREEKPELFRRASLFVYPSFYEGFGFPPLEAMASGVPVITSYSSSLAEVCGNGAIMVDPGSFPDICDAMTQLISDEKLRSRMVVCGLENARKYTWTEAAKKYLKVFDSI